ncbi:MAG: hypothetical protein H7233_15635 [Pseudorhodobacter sp.]|nr:hypothetical protein [Frankiaceae bacterium]
MRITRKPLLVVALSAGMLATSATGALAYGSYGGYNGGDNFKAASYINNDRGTATNNVDVNDNSSCFAPDQYDMQKFSDAGTANRNVHNDACFLDSNGNKVGRGIGATYEARGVGFISACPDPDLTPATATRAATNGPEFSKLTDTNGDGRMDRCVQSSYQDRNQVGVNDAAGDFEYHARVNDNNAMAGDQDVKWGLDRELDGLDYRGINDSIKVTWSADGLAGSSYGW